MELTNWNIPVLALRGLTVFPHMTLTFDVERRISIAALERAMEEDQEIFLVTQREIGVNLPEEKDLYAVGTVSHISQILRLSPTSVRCVVEGRRRARLKRLWQVEPYLQANVEALPEEEPSEAFRKSPRTEALLRQTYHLFSEYAEMAGGIAEEVLTTVMDSRDPGFLADYIAQNAALRFTDKQEILEEISPFARLRKLNSFLARENNVIGFEHELEGKVRDQLVSSQREQILRTQIRVLQNELGETDDDDEIETYRQKIVALELDEDTEKHLLKEVNKLAKQPFGSGDALEGDHQGARQRGGRPQGAGKGPLRPGEGQRADSGDHRRPADESGGEGADPLPGRPSGRGQDVHSHLGGQGAESEAGPDLPGRRPG